ncbi:MAG: outer membrane integrity protein, partial [Cytophagaceae bacterium]
MKKGILIFFGVIMLLFSVLLIVPVIFKDEIKAKIDAELAKTVNAEIAFETNKFSLSLIRNFPNITIGIDDFGLIGKADDFKGDTLFSAKSMYFTADIMSVIFGDQIKVRKIYLGDPYILTKFTKDGKSSWDIMMASEEEEASQEEEAASEFAIAIDKWEIKNGHIIYDDASMPVFAEFKNLDHIGNGDLTQDVFDVKTFTSSPHVKVVYDGVTYMEDYFVEADVKLNMNMLTWEYKFLENEFKVNNFKFGFDGLVAMPDDDIRMDITYKATETEFKNLISLIPALYAKEYESIKTEGTLAFDGWVKGIYNDSIMPAFGLNLMVDNAMMQYPDLPTAVKNVVLDMHVDNKDGIIDNTVIDIKKFHMDMGNNPVDARVLVEGLAPYKIDADVSAKLNLAEITQFYPVDGTILKGLFALNVKAKGIYSDTQWPVVDALMSMKDGFVKTEDVPEPMEALNFNASVKNTDGSLESTVFNLENFSMRFQNEPFEAKALIENMDNPKYDVSLKGILDFAKLTKIYPLEDMTLAGKAKVDMRTKGVMSDIDAGRYDKTSTNGSMTLTNFHYESPDMPQGMKLTNAVFALDPLKMEIKKMDGYLGKSDISVTGFFSNYMGYMFGHQDTILKGNMTFASKKFDTNEWMTDDETAAAHEEVTEASEIFEVPKDLDFVLASSINEVLYDNMNMKDMKGTIIMKDGILRMDKLAFNSLGGSFLTNGSYNTQNIQEPKFDM